MILKIVTPNMGSSSRCRRTSRGLALARVFGVMLSFLYLLGVANGWTVLTPTRATRTTKSSWTSFVARIIPRDEVLCYSQPEYSYYDSNEGQKEPRRRNRGPPSADRGDYWREEKDENYRKDPYESNTRTVASNDDDPDEYYYDEDDYENDGYLNNEDDYYYDDDDEQQPPSNGKDTNSLEWETLSTDAGKVHVLLPRSPPTAVLHFVGGTGVGSAPTVWYRRLLHDVVEQTQVAVVATSIPVTLLQSPLQHVPLARKLSRQLHIAYEDVLCDEYGKSAMKDIPLCGLGHSLGSRLLVVLATLQQPSKSSKHLQYKSFILTSFTNYGAAAGIPGLQQLGKSSRQVDRDRMRQARKQKQQQQPKRRRRKRSSRNAEDDDDWFNDNDNDEYGYYDDDDDDDEEEWGEIFQDLQASLQDQALSVRRALTPSAETLEFHPSPTLLWKALGQDQRYNIPHTLVVQLDNDEMDQSVPLANAIRQTSNVKFARLRGTHWTMVSPGDDWQKDWRQQLNLSRALKALAGRKQSQANEESWRDLRQTIARYITEVVTKD